MPFRARRIFATVSLGAILLLSSGRALGGGGTFLGPFPYLSKADSPFLRDVNAGQVYLEDFECGVLTVPGVTPSTGAVIPPGFLGLIGSVDADDGAIDGSGLNGHSFFSGDGATGITFTFSQATLGAFPTQVGIVWTDGGGSTTFEAFDSTGVSLGTIGPVAIAVRGQAGVPLLSSIPDEKAIVFVRYAPGHDAASELITNEPDLNSARVRIVYDRGEENPVS